MPVRFATNQAGTPINMTHPVSGDDSQFKILESGVYLIGWTLSMKENAQTITRVSIQLWNTTLGQAIGPDPFQIEELVDGAELFDVVSGQTIVKLSKETILQLRLQATLLDVEPANLLVFNPTLFIMKIA